MILVKKKTQARYCWSNLSLFRLDKLDEKIDATMKVTKFDPELLTTNLPVGYVCAAKYSVDEK